MRIEPNMAEMRAELVTRALALYEGQLVEYTTRILGGDLDRARDVVQDALIKLFQQDPTRMEEGGLKSWLFTVCRHRALDVMKKDRRLTAVDEETWQGFVSPGFSPLDAAQNHEDSAEVMHFVDRLTANQREVVLLKYQHSLSYKEISRITSLSASNVGFLLHSAVKRLREMMGAQLAEQT